MGITRSAECVIPEEVSPVELESPKLVEGKLFSVKAGSSRPAGTEV